MWRILDISWILVYFQWISHVSLEIFLFQTILCLRIHDHDSHHCDSVLEASDTESLAEVLIELSLLIGTDATTPFIQERCHWGRWHLRVNYRQFSIYKGRFYQIWVELGKATPNSQGWWYLSFSPCVFFCTLDWDWRLMKSPFSLTKSTTCLLFSFVRFPELRACSAETQALWADWLTHGSGGRVPKKCRLGSWSDYLWTTSGGKVGKGEMLGSVSPKWLQLKLGVL